MPRLWTIGLVAVCAATSVAACGDTTDTSLCPAFRAYMLALGDLSLDSAPTSVDDAIATVDAVLAETRKLQAVADERHSAEIDRLATSLDDLRRTLQAIEPDAAPSTWGDAVDDSIADVADAATSVDDLFRDECTDSSTTSVTT